jgi:autotransporter-associated beta strand protein
VSCTGAGLTGLAAGLYPLITWTGAMSGITPSVTLSSGSGNLVRDDLNKTLWLNITASTQLLTWQGPAGSEWKANDSAFTWWQDATLATTYYKESTVSGTTIGDSVTFSNTPGGGVTLNSTVYPSSLLVSATSDYTFSGSGGIGGGCNLTKSSSGKLTLANANTFAGAMIVSGGTLQLAHADAISSSSGLVVQGGNATVDATVGLKSLLFDTTVARTVTGTGTLAFAPGATIRNSDNRIDCTISTPITGSPAVETKDLGAGNTYLGLKFAPASGTQALGAVLNPNNTGTTDKAGVTFAGSTTGNTVALIAYAGGDKYADTVFASGGWTVAGNITTGTVKVTGGTHTWNGTVTTDYNQTQITGGTVKGTFMLYSSDKRSASYVSGTGTISPGTSIGTVTIDWGTAGTPAAGIGDYSFSLQNGSTYEWEIGAANTTDKIHLVEGRLYLQNFTLRILAAGGSPVSTDQLPVFTYVTGVTRDLTGFPNLPANFILPAGWTGTPTLVDNGTGIIYLTGVSGVNNPYATWAGTGNNAFDADANNDGVDNGMAWVLGALDKDANAIALLPTLDNTTDPDFFIFTYRRDDEAGTDPKTTIKVEYGSDLAGWTPAVAGADIIITPADEGAGVGIDLVQVKIRRTLAVGGKLFARLNVANTP